MQRSESQQMMRGSGNIAAGLKRGNQTQRGKRMRITTNGFSVPGLSSSRNNSVEKEVRLPAVHKRAFSK